MAALALEKSNRTPRIELDCFPEFLMIKKNSANYHAVSTGKDWLEAEGKAAGCATGKARQVSG
jgi:hypothetical protein